MLSQVRTARPAPAEPGPVIEHRLDESDAETATVAEVPRLAPIAVARSRRSDQIGRGAPWSGGKEAGRRG
jgi:hypothetical protein